MARRFEHRLIVVVAGPGLGKTELLAQAVAENQRAPRGEDVWLSCTPGDAQVSRLAGALLSVLAAGEAIPDDVPTAIELIGSAVWRRSPTSVALVLDDVHLIPAASPGAELLAGLIDRLPGNGHLVLAGRAPLPLSAGRLALRSAVTLGEADLAFDDQELAAFAALRAAPVELLAETSGWPALAELTVTAGEPGVVDYLRSDILSGFDPAERSLLAAVSVIGGAGPELLASLGGEHVDSDAVLARIPLVSRRADGWRVLHPLWAPVLEGELSPTEAAARRRDAARALRRLGGASALDSAMRLLIAAEAWCDVGELIRQVTEKFYPAVAADVLAEWLSLLPIEVRQAPDGLLLQGVAAKRNNLDVAAERLERAAEGYGAVGAADGAAVGAAAALVHLAHIRLWQLDAHGLAATLDKVTLLDGLEQTELWAHAALGPVLASIVADQQGTAVELLRSLPPMSGEPRRLAEWLWAMTLLALGEPEAALPHSWRCLDERDHSSGFSGLTLDVLVTWFAGRCDEALQALPRLADVSALPRDYAHNVIVARAAGALLCGLNGDRAAATWHLEAAESAALLAAEDTAEAHTLLGLARTAAAVDGHAEDLAAAELTRLLELHRLDHPGLVRLHRLALPLTYVLVPATRVYWDEAPLAGCWERARTLARVLVQLRNGAGGETLTGLELPPARAVRAMLPIAWATELAVGLIGMNDPQGSGLLHALPRTARDHLTSLPKARPRLAGAVRTALSIVPRVPKSRLRLLVLGSLEVYRNGQRVVHADLRRERVRQLLLYLVAHPNTTRAQITDALWPDEDDQEAASRNLRVTLAYLQRVLEPDRDDEPYFVRGEGTRLRLVVDDWLELDSREFDQLRAQAKKLDAVGHPARALELYQRALALYRDDYMADVLYADWAAVDRHRYERAFLTTAVRTGELLLARGSADTAIALARRALRIDTAYEPAYRLLAAAHLADGDRSGAHRALAACHKQLRHLGLAPEPATEMLTRRLGPTAVRNVQP